MEDTRTRAHCEAGIDHREPAGRAAANAIETLDADGLRQALRTEIDERRRVQCMAQIQDQAAQLALDLLVTEPDITGFFAAFTKTLVEECDSHACGVWIVDEHGSHCDLWMAHLHGELHQPGKDGWQELALPREDMSAHLLAYAEGWARTVEYRSDDARLPESVRAFNSREQVESVTVAPLLLGSRALGWIAMSTGDAAACQQSWRVALLEAIARQATLALYQSRLAERRRLEDRRKAILEERNRLARDIHDTLAQGFGAILMQLQAAQRQAGALPTRLAGTLDTAVHLARTHLIEARRSVAALRPNAADGQDLATALARLAELARLTTDVPIDVIVDPMPSLDVGVEREIIGIAQEALTNAARHAHARRIRIHASAPRDLGFRLSVADDGRGIAWDRRNGGFGMTSMQERAERIGASLTIVTAPRSGTEVVLAWQAAPAHA